MLRYALIRLVQSVITLIGVSIIVFFLTMLAFDPYDYFWWVGSDSTGDDSVDIISEAFGLNDPLYMQYLSFVKYAAQGDFGYSFKWQGRTAMQLVLLHFPYTLQLAVVSIGVTLLLAVPTGVMSAVKKGAVLDTFGKLFGILGHSMPSFLLGIMLIWIFAEHLEWLPTSGRGGLSHWILPAIALGWFSVAAVVQLTRASMLEALDSNYIKMARIKGIPEWKVVWKHGLANAAISVLAAFPILAAMYMVNTVAIETVFAWPGVGLLALQAVVAGDLTVVRAITMLIAVLYIGISLLIDILCAYIDPRIRQA